MQTSEGEAWRSLHPSMILFELGRSIRSFLAPMFISFFIAGNRQNNPGLANAFLLLFFVVVLPLFTSLLRFISYRYKLEAGHVTIREGVLSRKVRRIPVGRIHNINTSQGILGRVFGVLRLDIETAGGGAAEASLSALDRHAVEALQEHVRGERAAMAPEEEKEDDVDLAEDKPRELHRVTTKDLFLAGATTNRIGVILVAAFAFFEYTGFDSDRYGEWLRYFAGEDGTISFPIWGVAAGIIFLIGVAWVISIAGAFIRWYRFTIAERGEDLEISAGLLTLRRYTLPVAKIQALTLATSPIRRPFGLFRVKVRSAGHVGQQEGGRAESDLLVPLTNREHLGFFARIVWPDSRWDHAEWQGVHAYTRLRQFRQIVLMVGIILTALYYLADGFFASPAFLIGAAIVILPAAWGTAHLTWKQTAFAHDQDFLYIKTGFLGLHFWVIPIDRIQNCGLAQDPFQRIRGLATLVVDTAGADGQEAAVPNIPVELAALLFNRFSASTWRAAVDDASEPVAG